MLVYLGFDLPDVAPVCDLAAVHDLQRRLLREAERMLGPRRGCATIRPATFVATTTGCTRRVGDTISIELEINALRDWSCCVAELAHELVHALDGLTGDPSWLEEGVAGAFGAAMAITMFEDPPMYLFEGDYLEALRLTASIPDQFAAIKSLRAQGIALHAVTVQQLMAAAPGLSADHAALLCRPFRQVPPVLGRYMIG